MHVLKARKPAGQPGWRGHEWLSKLEGMQPESRTAQPEREEGFVRIDFTFLFDQAKRKKIKAWQQGHKPTPFRS
jgi:hypothetical protein